MKQLFPDKRKAITGQFFINESRIKYISRRALKKIKTWKAFRHVQTEDTELHFHDQFNNLVKNSFFNTVSNKYVLVKEKYQDRQLNN